MINAPAAAAWAVVGEGFGRIGEQAVPITASSLDAEPAIGEEIVDLWFCPGPFRDMRRKLARCNPCWRRFSAARGEPLRGSRVVQPPRACGTHLRDLDGTPEHGETDAPTICPRLKINGHTLRTISTVMRFDTAAEVTVSELRVELLFPADEETDAILRGIIARLTEKPRQ